MSSAPFCTHGNLPYSPKWRDSTLGLVRLIWYSRPVPHQQVHQPDLVTSTKFHHILPIKHNFPPSTFALSAPCLGFITTGHLHLPSLFYQMGWPNPWVCVSDFVQLACPTQAGTPARPSHNNQDPPHPTCQRYHSTLHLFPWSHLPRLGHDWPPYSTMGWPNPWAWCL